MSELSALHRSIISLPYKIGAVITGGGAGCITDLLSMGGMSAVLEEFNVPYGLDANAHFMRHVYLPSHCSQGAAILLAAAQAKRLLMMGVESPMAVACTASLYTEGQREGRVNQAWVCIAIDGMVYVNNIKFAPEQGREGQEKTLELNLLHWIANPHNLEVFYNGSLEDFCAAYTPMKATVTSPKDHGPLVFCGSFNPWHEGHQSSLLLANKRFPKRKNVVIELSAINADKGIINPYEVQKRLATIPQHTIRDDTGYPINVKLRVGTAPTFVNKLDVYANPLFVVGSDTMYRIGNPEYYRDYEKSMRKLAAQAEFFVMLRGHTEVEVKKNIPPYLYDKCVFAEHEFAHVSSTEIRNNDKN